MRDRTAGYLSDGYEFLTRRIPASGWLELRLGGLPAVAIGGGDAPEAFYTPGRFTRAGAMPPTTLRLLQDKGSVQSLDGEAHRRRKGQFLALMTSASIARLTSLFEAAWRRRVEDWPRDEPFVLLRQSERILCDAVCAWAGAPLDGRAAAMRTHEFSAMVGRAGSIGPDVAGALLLRKRNERWARRMIREQRSGRAGAAFGEPLAEVASWTDEAGDRLPVKVAAVELINLLRPTVAVARFIVLAAMALHRRPRWRERLRDGDDAALEAFAQEVRRYFPFFPAIAGRVLQPFEWRGRGFRTGEWVLADLHGANHDPARWADPMRFDPERFLGGASPDRIAAQGAGDAALDHRCPGERITVELIKRAAALLVGMDHDVPPQDLRMRINRMPTAPESGFVMRLR
ncbi:cytochrome P450 [Brevundimonas sp.]|uniref:cytochrome P450 n=1 Tax=Brevundimonas sp. TaxID=1871086 RepID=UPI002D600BBC|nr:cytochrome P450 [Brevundimonas sp.]HYD26613.1 cytochrome P450 [Brevundimonas sp.]